MEIPKEITEGMQRLIDDLRIQLQGLEARGEPGDSEKAKEIRIKLNAMAAKLDGMLGRRS